MMKRTCDSCVASKLKCTGTLPCPRCASKGLDCFYRARKKRMGTKMDQGDSVKRENFSPLAEQEETTFDLLKKTQGLQPHEKLSWSLFFILYKNFRAGCSRCWFERQIKRLTVRLEKQARTDLVSIVQLWTQRMEADFPDKITNKAVGCMEAIATVGSVVSKLVLEHGALHFHVPGVVCPASHSQNSPAATAAAAASSTGTAQQQQQQPPQFLFGLETMKQMFLQNFDAVAHLQLRTVSGPFPTEKLEIVVNDKFEALFGLTGQRMQAESRYGSGLLPWGGDVLCWIVPKESDIFSFLQVCALNFNGSHWGPTPTLRTVPSTHMVSVTLPTGRIVPCLLKCVHREQVDYKQGISWDISMTFEPIPEEEEEESPSSSATGESTFLPVTDASVKLAEDAGEVIFPELDFGCLEDDVFFKDLLEFASFNDL